MFKVLLYSFSMCRHKLYQILSISKTVPCFVLLIIGYFRVLYYTGQNRSGCSFQTQKCFTLSLFEATMQNQCWLKYLELYFLRNLSFFLFFFLFCIFQLYIMKFWVCCCLSNCRNCKGEKLRFAFVKYTD